MKIRRAVRALACAVTGIAAIYGCSHHGKGETPNGGNATVSVSLSVVNGSAFAPFAPPSSPFLIPPGKNVAAYGSGLASLKLFIQGILICQNVTLNGTAVTGTTGCKSLYDKSGSAFVGTNLSSLFSTAQTTTDGYIDVMDSASRAQVSQSVSFGAADAHDYNFGIVTWAPPVKVRATLADPADGISPILYTRAGTPSACSVNNNPYDCILASTPLTAATSGTPAPAEESIFLGSGNVVFKFQRPLTITTADVASGTSYLLKLAFNPNGIVQGVTSPGATNFPPLADGVLSGGGAAGINMGNTISLVGAQFAPIFSPAGTAVARESYTATLTTPDAAGTYDLRIEFYSLASDPTHTIYGVNAATIPTANTTGYLVGYQEIYGVTTNPDDSVDLLDYAGATLISNFHRTATLGSGSTATITCNPVIMHCAAGTTTSATFVLRALDTLN